MKKTKSRDIPHISNWINAYRGYDQLGNKVPSYKLQLADEEGKLHGNQDIVIDPRWRELPSNKYLFKRKLSAKEQHAFDEIESLQRKNLKDIEAQKIIEKKRAGDQTDTSRNLVTKEMQSLLDTQQTLENQIKPFNAKQGSRAGALYYRARSVHHEVQQLALLNSGQNLSKDERFRRLVARGILLSHLYAPQEYVDDRRELLVATLGKEIADVVLGIPPAVDKGALFDYGKDEGAEIQGGGPADRPDEGSPSDTVTMESAAYKKAVQAKIDAARLAWEGEPTQLSEVDPDQKTPEGKAVHDKIVAAQLKKKKAGPAGADVRRHIEKYLVSLPPEELREKFGRDPLLWTLKLYPRKFKTTPWFVGDQLLEIARNLIQNTPKNQRSVWMQQTLKLLEQNFENAQLRDSYHMSFMGGQPTLLSVEDEAAYKELDDIRINDVNDDFLKKAYQEVNTIYMNAERDLTEDQVKRVGEAHQAVKEKTDSPEAIAEFLSYLKKAGRGRLLSPFKYLSPKSWQHLVRVIWEGLPDDVKEKVNVFDLDTINYSQNKKIINWTGEESTEFEEVISRRRKSIILTKTGLYAKPVLGAPGGKQRTLEEEEADPDFKGEKPSPRAYKIKPQKPPAGGGLPLADQIKVGGVFRFHGRKVFFKGEFIESIDADIVSVNKIHPGDDLISIAESNGVNTEKFLEMIKSGWAVGEEFYQVHILPKADRLENVRPPIPDGPLIREHMRDSKVKPVTDDSDKRMPMNFSYGKNGLPGTKETTFDEIFEGQRRSTLRRKGQHGLKVGDRVEVFDKQGRTGMVLVKDVRTVDPSMAEELSETERWTPEFIQNYIKKGEWEQILYEPEAQSKSEQNVGLRGTQPDRVEMLKDAKLEHYKSEVTGIDFGKLDAEIIGHGGWTDSHLTKAKAGGKFKPKTQMQGDTGTSYYYTGKFFKGKEIKPWSPMVQSIKDQVEKLTGYDFNLVLIQRYHSGSVDLGWHSDLAQKFDPKTGEHLKSELGDPESVVVSVNFGAERTFAFRRAGTREGRQHGIPLGDGDVLVMMEGTNANYQHSLLKTEGGSGGAGPRINLTFRQTSQKLIDTPRRLSEAQPKPKGKPLKIGKRGEKSSRLGLPGMGREGYFHYPLKQGNKNIGDVILRKPDTAAGNLDPTWDLLFLKLNPEYQGTGLGMQWLESEIDKALNKGISPTLQKVQSKKIQEWAKKKGGIFSKIKKDGEVGQILFKATKEQKKKVGWRGLTSEEMDEAVGNVETAKVDISSSTRKSPYFQKDLKKFKDATKLISRGSGKSSSAAYADAAGAKANTGEYDSSDVVVISAEGARKNRIGPDYDEIQLAIDAGVTFITDNPEDRARKYNVGEREVAAFLTENGYEETSPGKWSPK